MEKRTEQVQMDAEVLHRAQEAAKAKGVRLSEYIEWCVRCMTPRAKGR